jgi:DNA sulfur modification protein DndD
VRIKSIELRNFRAYQGITRIDFPTPKGKDNITLISGKNGFGKTSFLTSILWGFYGKLISKVEDKIIIYTEYGHILNEFDINPIILREYNTRL